MRENVESLLKIIPADCKDLTIHDITHLDALWEMASLLVGDNSDLNPAETFVLGAAILLHDAGLSVASFTGGLSEIKSTIEWRDTAAAILRQHGINPSPKLIDSPPETLLSQIKFAVVRALHARQAENMATSPWTLRSGEQIYLLDDVELRQSFGLSIGRVAHSHHWSVDKLSEALIDNVGAGTVLPAEWSVSERKVACILRCADACHMDRRRAPTILYAATKPEGISDIHWNAQNKINKPTVKGSTIIFSSGQAFRAEDADAWWLVYDLIRVADGEIRASNALLEEIGFSALSVKRVLGAESPRSLAVQIRADGWRPIDAEVRVSDPVGLAKSLGGHRLYGRDAIPPIRELVQNAADAVRARRQFEDRAVDWGDIKLTLEPDEIDDTACWLHVDDNGIGMSERVLAGPLVDFGKSIWNSSLLREEFPGLESKNLKPVGKFGIGFFSVFELAKHVKVISRKFDAAASDVKVLEFRSLATRPLIRNADPKELPRDMSTRVSLKVENKAFLYERNKSRSDRVRFMQSQLDPSYESSLDKSILKLISMLDVKFDYSDRVSGKNFQHSPDIYNIGSTEFLEELYSNYDERYLNTLKSAYRSLLRPIKNEEGENFGRAALSIIGGSSPYRSQPLYISVGGFVVDSFGSLPVPIIGALEGYTDNVARQDANVIVTKDIMANWATEQGQILGLEREKFRDVQLLDATRSILKLSGDPGSLPYCFAKGKLEALKEVKARISSHSRLIIPLREDYGSSLRLRSYQVVRSDYFQLRLHENVFVLHGEDSEIFDDETARLVVKEGRSIVSIADIKDDVHPIQEFIEIVRKVWDHEPAISVETVEVFEPIVHSPPAATWAIVLKRSDIQ